VKARSRKKFDSDTNVAALSQSALEINYEVNFYAVIYDIFLDFALRKEYSFAY
jgi:hypothetical protein